MIQGFDRTGQIPLRRLAIVAMLIALIGASLLHAQPQQPTTGVNVEDVLKEEGNTLFPSMADSKLNPIERSIDPATYYPGPSDVLFIIHHGSIVPSPITAVVSYDNLLVLPRSLSPVDVTGLSLKQVERKVDSVFRARSSDYGPVKLSLYRPRTIYVTVTGNVIAPGRKILTSADRVTTAIEAANRVPDELATIDDELMDITKRSLLGVKSQYGSRDLGTGAFGESVVRDVVVRHLDGTMNRVDLLRYRAFGISDENPTLREGDVINVEFPDNFTPRLSIAGAVNNPVVGLPFREGDNLPFLLSLAAGVRKDGDISGAYVVRQNGDGTETRIGINLNDSNAIKAFDIVGGDKVIVPPVATAKPKKTGIVSVIGEVVSEGVYEIDPGKTKLSEVIQMAGGFTPFASLNGAYIRRPDDPLALRPAQQTLDLKAGMATSTLALEDTLRYVFDQQVQKNMVSADFVAIFEQGIVDRDVVLMDGDVITVPREAGQVYIIGRVRHPGWVQYREGEGLDFYIDRAGGYTAAAAPKRVAIQKYGTGVWDGPCCTLIESGDYVYVPGERDTPARTTLENSSFILSIIASIVTITRTIIEIVNDLTN